MRHYRRWLFVGALSCPSISPLRVCNFSLFPAIMVRAAPAPRPPRLSLYLSLCPVLRFRSGALSFAFVFFFPVLFSFAKTFGQEVSPHLGEVSGLTLYEFETAVLSTTKKNAHPLIAGAEHESEREEPWRRDHSLLSHPRIMDDR